jgi:hypothetical protein
MTRDTPLPTGGTVVVDTNVFFAIGGPSNEKYRRFRDAIRAAETTCCLPRRVVGELGGPETDRIEAALGEGWAEIVDAPDPTDGDAVAATDIARRTIATETDQAEHDVEKTDTILAGLAVQFVQDHAIPVVVVTNDSPARSGIEHAVTAQGYDDTVDVYGVEDIVGEDSDEPLRLV